MKNLLLLPAATICQREFVRFLRYPSRIIGALGTPIVFWLLIGSGINASFGAGGSGGDEMNYLEYFFPGALLLNLLFTSIFTMISVIEDKQAGFLLSALVAPVSRAAIVIGKVTGGAALATVQAFVFVALAPLAGVPIGWTQVAMLAGILSLISVALTGMGFLFAWQMESTQGFHSVINLFLIPLWFLSGAIFPVSQASSWVRVAMKLNPLSYADALVRHSFYLDAPSVASLPGLGLSLAVLSGFTVVVLGIAFVMVSRPLRPGLG